MTTPTGTDDDGATGLSPAFIAAATEIFEQRVAFNRLLGLRLTSLTPDRVTATIDMRPELIGNFKRHMLHGGVISAGLDTMGGLAVLAAAGARHAQDSVPAQLEHFERIGTVDLRIDYLRPGIGTRFELRGHVLRLGRRLANTRMEFLDADGRLLAVGAGVFTVA